MGVNNIKALWLRMTSCGRIFTVVFPTMLLYFFNGSISAIITVALLIYIGWERQRSILHDKKSFKQPPPNEDCPICMIPLPTLGSGSGYYSCCGKTICAGCLYAVAQRDKDQKCPFCRIPAPDSEEELIGRIEKRVQCGDSDAICNLGCYYYNGKYGLTKDVDKALELWHQAGELGNAAAYSNISVAYFDGDGVERDEKTAKYYYELAAIGGNLTARYNLGSQ